jgi:hypothetical protein
MAVEKGVAKRESYRKQIYLRVLGGNVGENKGIVNGER